MPFIGNQPAESYASFETETFSVSATTNYTLSHAVTNENEIRLVINGVVQQPGSGKAYTASGTTLTLSSATASGDSMYAVYLGRALQTVNPPNASVGNSQTAPTIITGQTAETSIATDDTILIHDTSASALRKMTRANFVSGIGGDNTPAFKAKSASSQSVTNASDTLVVLGTEVFDTDNAFSSNRFTVPSGEGGKYYFTAGVGTNSTIDDNKRIILKLHKNGSQIYDGYTDIRSPSANVTLAITLSTILDLSATDYIELYFYTSNSDSGVEIGGNAKTFLSGFKLIGI